MSARLLKHYKEQVVAQLTKEKGYMNPMAVPRVRKIVLNMGLGEATQNSKILDSSLIELGQISGQRPVATRARKSIANFKIRKGMAIGAMVTLRGESMYEFLDRLVNIALPRVRDFRGLSIRTFDGRGNYTLGLRDQIIFPEVDYSNVDRLKGMNVCFVTDAKTDAEALSLLQHMGVPFRDADGRRMMGNSATTDNSADEKLNRSQKKKTNA